MKTDILLETGTNELEVLEFTVGGKSFGINVAKVKELMQRHEVRHLPNAHPCVEGVFQPRDEVYTVIDLAAYLGMPPSEDATKDIYIIAHFNSMKVAFHVHGVESIHRFSWEQIEKPDEIIYGGQDGIVTGIVKMGGKISTILDFEKIAYDISPRTGIKMEEIDQMGERSECDRPILIAEDSMLLRKMLVESLNRAGYSNILSVTNGAEAWSILAGLLEKEGKPEDAVALLITDIEMPQMDGLHLTKRIKEDKALRKIPVVIFSSIIDEQMSIKCKQVGADAQLTKPEIGKLVKVIDDLI